MPTDAALASFLALFPRTAAPSPRRIARLVPCRSSRRSAHSPSRDQVPPPHAAPRSMPAPPRTSSDEIAAAGFVPWRARTRKQVVGRQHHSSRPVAPRLTKRILHTAVVSLREPLERNRWTRYIAAKSLQSLAITPVHRNPRVDVHAPNLRHERRCQAPFRGPNRLHELLRPLTRTLAEEAHILRRRPSAQ